MSWRHVTLRPVAHAFCCSLFPGVEQRVGNLGWEDVETDGHRQPRLIIILAKKKATKRQEEKAERTEKKEL
jgi:hypothetical protein